MVVDTRILTTAPQQGSLLSAGGRIAKIVFWVVLILVVLAILLLASKLAEHGATLDPSTWDDAAITWAESSAGVTDTGDSAGGSFLSAIWWGSIFGVGGGLLGLGTTSSGFAGAGEALGKSRDSFYTFFKRVFGW